MKSLKIIVVSLLVTSLLSCKKEIVVSTPEAANTHLKLTFTNISNAPVANPSSAADWNSFFATATNATTAFTSVKIVGNEVELIGGKGLTIKQNAFYRSASLVKIEDDSTVIGVATYAFANAFELNSVSLNYATSIGANGFQGNAKTVTVSIKKAVNIGNAAFDHNLKLKTVFAENVETIGESAFGSCNEFAVGIFPKCTNVGDAAFAYCPLTNLDLRTCLYLGNTISEDFVFYAIAGKTISIKIPAATATDADIAALQIDNNVTITQ